MSDPMAIYITSRDQTIALLDNMTDEIKQALRRDFPGSTSIFIGYEDPTRLGTQIGEVVDLREPAD